MEIVKACYFCVHKNEVVDYKNIDLLQKFISSHFKISKRKRSGLCAKHQRKVAESLKRARFIALLPYVPA